MGHTINIQKIPLKTVMEVYDISKTTIYKLVDEKTLTPHYFRGSSTKPYFAIQEIENALRPEIGGGTKRRK